MHKSQGMTLDYVKADVKGVFTEAQAYVALSRATNENGLELRNFSSHTVRADPRALHFYACPDDDLALWDEEEEEKPSSSTFLKENIHPGGPPAATPGCLDGLTFVLTGEPEGNDYSRHAAEKLIRKCGGVIRSAISGKTHYLVIGPRLDDGRPVSSSKKYQSAQAMINGGNNKSNLQIITKDGLFSLIRNRG